MPMSDDASAKRWSEGETVTSDWSQQDEYFMYQALECAKMAQQMGEIPVGAVLVKDGEIIAKGWNQSITSSDPSAHAEVQALRAAGKLLGNYRLLDTTLYVTLEPCAMCAGALLSGRVSRIVYGASDQKTGAAGTVINLFDHPIAFHRARVEHGLLAEESQRLLQTFFKHRRAENKARRQAQKLATMP